jgi:hypothetical protein
VRKNLKLTRARRCGDLIAKSHLRPAPGTKPGNELESILWDPQAVAAGLQRTDGWSYKEPYQRHEVQFPFFAMPQ